MVARQADAAERGVRWRAVGRLVPVDHAGFRPRPELLELLVRAADEARGQPESGRVRGRDRRVEILDPDDLQDGPENLLVRDIARVGDVDQRRGQVRTVLVGPVEAADRLSALHHQAHPLFLKMMRRFVVDQRAHERLRFGEGRIDDDPVDRFGDRLDQRSFLAFLDDQPPGAGATLAGAEIGGLHDDRRRRVDVLRVPGDQRVVSAKLQRKNLLRRVRELLVQRLSGTR